MKSPRLRRALSRQPIRVRLMILSAVTSTAALLLACSAFWTYETVLNIQALFRESFTLAQMLADSAAAPLTFHDAAAGRETAETLRAEPRIAKACFYTGDGKLLASYRRAGTGTACPPPRLAPAHQYTWDHLALYYPVLLNRELAGSVFLEIGLAELYTRSFRYAFISGIVLCVALLFALALSSRLQRMISDPILHLTHVAREVSGSGSYVLRAQKSFDDETGLLIDQFNAMMETISDRDLQLKRAQDELELRVQERTRSLRNEIAERKLIEQSLVHAKLAAEEANTAKSNFLANMSHELRTPLNAILGYSEMLEEDVAEIGQHSWVKDLQRIQSAGHHLLDLVTDILDISKIEAGAQEVRLERVEIEEITEGVVDTVEPLARKNGNRFLVSLNGCRGFVRVDPLRFRQSLLNLLSNACKFTEHGTITLSLRRTLQEEREFLCWEVRDTGIGIRPEDRVRLFRPFSQVDGSATRRHGGTGLGLAISQRLCRMMGGDITVESTPGEGSTFTILMPAEESAPAPQEAEAVL